MGDLIFDDKLLEELKKLTLYTDAALQNNDIIVMDYIDTLINSTKRNKDYSDMIDSMSQYFSEYNVPFVEEKPKMLEIKNTEKLGRLSNGTVKIISTLEDRYIIEYDELFTKTFYFDLYREYLVEGTLLLKCNNASFRNRKDIERRIDKDVLRRPEDLIEYLKKFVNELNSIR